jgi:hypothetical protein
MTPLGTPPEQPKARATLLSLALAIACAGAVALAAACANPSAPPGGPPDELPPLILDVTPAIGDTSVQPKVVTLQFDEVISESPAGSPDLASLVFISPRSGDVNVSWKRSRMDIRPKAGFRDSTVYTITVRPGIQDLRNNKIDSITTIVFSTRGPIPNTVVGGVLFDWPAGRGARDALVEAISVVDTTVAYVGVTDSVGRFKIRHVPAGQYLVRGFVDRNNNRALERTELWDTLRVPLRDSTDVELYGYIHDTTAARMSNLVLQDSGRLLVATFDKPLAISQLFTPDQWSVRTLPDSTPVPQRVVRVRTRLQQQIADSVERKRRADSLAATRDTAPPDSAALARADSVSRIRRRDSIAAAERAQREERRLLALRGGRPVPKVDSTPPPKPSRTIPSTELLVLLDGPLPPNARIVVEVKGIATLSGVTGDVVRPYRTPDRDTTPRPPARAATPPDSGAQRDTAAPPDTTTRVR